MTQKKAETILVISVACRAVSYMFSKVALDDLEPFNLLAIRFLSAAIVLTVIFRKKFAVMSRRTMFHGMLIGAAYFLVTTFELNGLCYTDSGTTAFIENTAIVLVPIFLAVMTRKMPGHITVISAVLALSGVGFLTLGGASASAGAGFMHGVVLCFGAAVMYAVAMIITDRFAAEDDPVTIGILQMWFLGLFALPASLATESTHLPVTTDSWFSVAALVIVCSIIGFTTLPIAQRYVSAERVSLFCGLAPLIAGVSGAVFLHESFTAANAIGTALIIVAIFVPEIAPKLASPSPRTKVSHRAVRHAA